MKLSYILIALLVIAVLYLVFMPKTTDTAAAPVVRAPVPSAHAAPHAASASPTPLQVVKPPAPMENHRVEEITSMDHLKTWIDAKKPGILLVYGSYCGHCKNMMPAFESASTTSAARFARVEGQRAQDFMRQHEIRGVPTMFLLNSKGELQRHQGGRDITSLLNAANSTLA